MTLEIAATFGKPERGVNARWVTLTLAGVTIFKELASDIDTEGKRTVVQAQESMLAMFASRLRDVLEYDA